MRRFVRSLLVAAVLLLPVAADAAPVSPNSLKPRGYVNDFAEVIEPEWEQRLTSLLTQLDQRTKAQIAVVTLRSLEGEPIEDFANKLFQVWGVGHKDHRGALLLLVIQDRKSRLEVGYGLEPIVPDGFAGSVLREMRPALREKKYGQALYAGVGLLAQHIAQASGVTLQAGGLPPAAAVSPTASPPAWVAIPMVLLIFLVPVGFVIFFIVMSVKRPGYWRRLAAYSAASGWSSSTRSSGFGGFGGYDSGGSGGGFGGFGGGSSGGGGASSSW